MLRHGDQVAVVTSVAASVREYRVGERDVLLPFDVGTIVSQLVWSSPYLFLGAFMLSEPLTLPPRRWQQFIPAAEGA